MKEKMKNNKKMFVGGGTVSKFITNSIIFNDNQ